MTRTAIRKMTALLLAAVVVLALLPGCQDKSRDIPYSTAFITPSAPKGYATPDTIAFYTEDEAGNPVAENVSPEEIAAFSAEMKTLPRTVYFNRFLPENLLSLLPVLDYAMYHGYSKICIPTAEYEGSEVVASSRYLRMIYHINESGVTGRTVASFENEAGDTVNYVFVGIMGLNTADASRYRQALEEAARIVDSVPDGYGEYETALYLYRYLTDNVQYYWEDYYGSDWNLLYDALINKSTVCAGYSEALYVLYNLAGIECFSIEGYIPGGDGFTTGYDGSHVWNVARIDGVYYEFDPTWDEGVCVADYRFFGVSTEDLVDYYPRTIASFTDEYCPPRTESLFPRVGPAEDSVDYRLLYAALEICNICRSNPSALLRIYGYSTDVSELKSTDDGWIITPISYDAFRYETRVIFSDEVADAIFSGCIREENGKLAFKSQTSIDQTYRFCGMEDGVPVVCIMDARGRFTRGHAEYHLGANGVSACVLDSLTVIPD